MFLRGVNLQIKDMFEKDIERDIKGVVKVGQKDEDTIYNELDEYVVTNELFKHFSEFFRNYNNGILNPTDDMGVWISGFFGSGKSHFLKILSYILDSSLTVKGRKPMDFFKEDNKIKDPMVIADMENATSVSTDVILFNIDSKSSSQSSSNKDDILSVFNKVFNEMRGYSPQYPFLANLEKELDEEGQFEKFKEAFLNINGKPWEEVRGKYYFIQDDIIDSLVEIGFMSIEEANRWADNAEEHFDLSIESFAKEINEYCENKGEEHHVVFLVDEVGQYIADDTKLMLNLQTIVEELGIKCSGNAWVIVTSQQNIDDITRDFVGTDFSKIQGRFKTRLSLSSSNVDEVIRRRILAKNETAQQMLEAQFPDVEASLKNIISFEKSAEMKNYKNAEDFANIYPFVPYQFNLVQNVLTSVREHSASSGHMADGERSMLALFQESAIEMKDKTEGALVPFNTFFKAIGKFIDHTHQIVISKAMENDSLNDFDVEVLKILFLIKYVKEIKATSKNLTTLMISNVKEDRITLNKKIDASLKRLEKQTLIQKNGDVYSFLTNEEQDIRREIKKQLVDPGEILDEASNRIYSEIYPKTKYRVSNRYNFSFNQAIDTRDKSSKKHDIGMRIISPYYESNLTMGTGQTSLDNGANNIYNALKGLSDTNNEVIVQLPQDLVVFDEIKETLQIQKYLTKNSSALKPDLKAIIQEEYNDKVERIRLFLEEAVKNAIIYVKGDKVDIVEKNAEARLDEAMSKLVAKVYNKLGYMTFAPDKSDILAVLNSKSQEGFQTAENESQLALDSINDYVNDQDFVHTTPSLKVILDRFSSAPYGFHDLDIQWLVAKLFVDKNISLTINNEDISIKKEGSQKVLDYLTRGEYREKVLLGIKEIVSPINIKDAKEVLKDLFDYSIASDDSEKIMDEFKKVNTNKLAEINEKLILFNSNSKYPGKSVLEESRDLLMEVNGLNNESSFFKFISQNIDDFLDIADDLSPVLAFFNGAQRKIFNEACDTYKDYEDNKNLINDTRLSEIANGINRIISMPSPYSFIKDLPALNKEFDERIDSILDEERAIIAEGINSDEKLVLDSLNTPELIVEFKEIFTVRFNNLRNKLAKERNLAIIKGISTESDNLRVKCLNEVQKFIGRPPEIRIKTISLQKLVSKSKVSFQNEEEVEAFLKLVEDKIKDQIKENDVVNISF